MRSERCPSDSRSARSAASSSRFATRICTGSCDSITRRVDQLVAQLNEGQGTAGQLLKDKQLYENMNGAVSELRNLVRDIRADPRKYLNVRVRLF